MARIQLFAGDITTLAVDAIVNAANQSLLGGGGVDGAIHHAAGPQLVAASRLLAPCPAGDARRTAGFDLPAGNVIHAVGPIYRDGNQGEADTLRKTYQAVLRIAADQAYETIAVPCISTGAYAFPADLACQIAIDAVIRWQEENEHPATVIFCCFEQSDVALYTARMSDLGLLGTAGGS